MALSELLIPDLKQVLAEQNDLAALISAGHPAYWPDRELFWPNRNYGFSTILTAHAGWPLSRPLPAVMPHGVRLELYAATAVHPYDLHPEIRSAMAYPDFVASAYAATEEIDNVVEICSPFLYALDEFRRRYPDDIHRQGTVFPPRHSTAAKKVRSPYRLIADSLHKLPSEFQPIRVCVHWQDVIDGLAGFFRDQGFPVFCCCGGGGLHGLQFLFRLLHILSLCRYRCSQSLISNTFYSIAAGVNTFLVNAPVEIIVDPRFPHHPDSPAVIGLKQRLHESLGTLDHGDATRRQQIANHFLGAPKQIAGPELHRLLLSCSAQA